ncbi:Fc.00g077840.m01.CDS01 [Cosmosporella sp. VM-42]
MAKRKRQVALQAEPAADPVPTKKTKANGAVKSAMKSAAKPTAKSTAKPPTKPVAKSTTKPVAKAAPKAEKTPTASETIQIVVGSYDRVLHGLVANIGGEDKDKAEFADTFLFNAHTSAIRCVAISPASAPVAGQTQKVLLASGSTDERINVYNLSAHPPSRKNQEMLAKVAPRPILENPKNRELGTLLHHSSTVTALRFPTRSKLLSSSEDSNIAVTRTRDWSLLSNIKAPIPTAQGRPSGDTAPFGGTPSGVNDFAIHPSMKLMISVSKGERSMRLWNLVTGKKAGVLNFSKDMLQEAGEAKHSTGEGRRVVWGSVDGADEFAVGFERDIVVFGMDSVPKCRVMPLKTKIHQFFYVSVDEEKDVALLAVATEDGRILFLSTKTDDLTQPETSAEKKVTLPVAKPVAQIGGKDNGVQSRIKDFVVVKSDADPKTLYVAGGSSDGKIRLWRLTTTDLLQAEAKTDGPIATLGTLLGTYETQNRITCMAAFLMIPRPEGVEDSEDEMEEESESDGDSD